MKTTFQIKQPSRAREPRSAEFNSSRSPVTDWGFHSSTSASRSPVVTIRPETQTAPSAPRLWALSQRFIETEAKREYRFEALLFSVVAALAAWPIGFALYIASETVR